MGLVKMVDLPDDNLIEEVTRIGQHEGLQMAKIEWSAGLEIGVPPIDEQHKRLVEMINELADSHSDGLASAAVETALADLVDYTVVHFDMEETFMEDIGLSWLV